MQIGVLSSVLASDPRAAFTVARELGFEGVQVEVRTAGLSLGELSRTGQREFVHLLAGMNLQLLSLATHTGRGTEKPGFSVGADVDRVVAHLGKCLKTAADLSGVSGRGVSGHGVVLAVDIGPLPPPPAVSTPVPSKNVDPLLAGALLLPSAADLALVGVPETATSEPRDTAFESQLDAALHAIGHEADRYGVRVAWGSELGAMGSLVRALDAVRCPWFGVELDPVAVMRDAWALERVMGALAGRVWTVRARDARKGSAGRVQATELGGGDAGFAQLLRLADEAHFSGPVIVDPTEQTDRAASAGKSLAYLRRLDAPSN